jgi:hypothetical protein
VGGDVGGPLPANDKRLLSVSGDVRGALAGGGKELLSVGCKAR